MRLFVRYASQLIRQRRIILIIGNESVTASGILLILAGIIALALLGKDRHLPFVPTLAIAIVVALVVIAGSWNSDKDPQHLKQLHYFGGKNSFFLTWGFTYSLLPAFVMSLFILVFAAPPFPFFVLFRKYAFHIYC